ncbi:PREDICTED: C-X-C motif chemokine 16 [Propithecus coquereli]|uniref:C-X-C motif chemokine 16 n=1 Tax=Propithecus coquereli TaxID=379532 RepID=UPI00063F113B|nr:PREDICTED: C-X-C motif chemokine 16 [Propithecus coquereli]
MSWGWGSWLCAVLFLLLELLILPGDGNEGSVTGSCHCDKRISSDSPPTVQCMNHLRKHLKAYHRCPGYIRFQLPSRSVCGGRKDQWVQELMRCLDRKECGRAHLGTLARREHLPPPSTQISEPSEGAPSDMRTPAQTLMPSTLQSTQHLTLPLGSLSLGKELPHPNETTTPTVGHSLGVGHEAGENQKQLEDNAGPEAGISALVAVPSLLGIIFILTGILVYLLCKRRKQSLYSSPDLQLHYTLVAPDSNA